MAVNSLANPVKLPKPPAPPNPAQSLSRTGNLFGMGEGTNNGTFLTSSNVGTTQGGGKTLLGQ